MKKLLSILIIAALLQSCTEKKETTLQGKWLYHYMNEDNTYHDFIAYFKPDGTYDGIDGGKVVMTGGRYEQKGDTIFLNDPVCSPHQTGIYKMVSYAGDSMYLAVIQDSCDVRRIGTDSIAASRVKE